MIGDIIGAAADAVSGTVRVATDLTVGGITLAASTVDRFGEVLARIPESLIGGAAEACRRHERGEIGEDECMAILTALAIG